MSTRRTVLGLTLTAVLWTLTGCGSSPSASTTGTGSAQAGSTATSVPTSTEGKATSAPAVGGGSKAGCSEFAGKTGVVRVFCEGPAKGTLKVDGKATTLSDGTCEGDGTVVAANFGVVTTNDFTGALPDYLGLVVDGEDYTIAAKSAGKRYAVLGKGTVSADKKTLHAEGKDIAGSTTLVVDVSCG